MKVLVIYHLQAFSTKVERLFLYKGFVWLFNNTFEELRKKLSCKLRVVCASLESKTNVVISTMPLIILCKYDIF